MLPSSIDQKIHKLIAPGVMPLLPGLLLLIFLTLVAYYPATKAGSIMDDNGFFLNDPVMVDPGGLKRIWFDPLDHNDVWPYIPITRSTFWLERQIAGINLQFTHWINILFHLLSAILLWLVLRKFQVPGAWLIGALFALHPVYVQSVAWIAERKNVVAAIFYFLCLWSYLYFDQKKDWRWYLISLGLFLCALLSKTSTIMLPVIFIFCRLWFRRTWKTEDILYLFSFFFIAAVMGYIRIQFELRYFTSPQLALDYLERTLLAGHVPFFYLSKVVFPYPLIYIYPKWTIDPGQLSMYLPFISLILVAGILLWKYKTWGRPLFLGLGAFLVTLFPVLGFFNNAWSQFSFVADHWVHLPSISILILGGQGMLWLLGKIDSQKNERYPFVSAGVWGICFVVLGSLTWNQTWLYQNHQTLWQGTLEKNPKAWVAYQELGREALQGGKYQQAIQFFEKTLTLKKDHPDAYNNRGVTYFHLRQLDQAFADFNAALKADPEFAEAFYNRGFVYADLKQFPQAIENYNKALEHKPNYSEAYFSRGNAYVRLNQQWRAIEDYNTALRYNPSDSRIYHNLGFAYFQLSQYEAAVLNFTKAIEINPQYAEAYHNRGSAHYYLKNSDQALQDYRQALNIEPNYAKAYSSLGFLYMNLGNAKLACISLERACQLGECHFYKLAQTQKMCP